MDCYYHPSEAAVTQCVACNAGICGECVEERPLPMPRFRGGRIRISAAPTRRFCRSECDAYGELLAARDRAHRISYVLFAVVGCLLLGTVVAAVGAAGLGVLLQPAR